MIRSHPDTLGRAIAHHREHFGKSATMAGVAPATLPIAGDQTDSFGGAVIAATLDLTCAAAISPRHDDNIVVHLRQATTHEGTRVTESISSPTAVRHLSTPPGEESFFVRPVPGNPSASPADMIAGLVFSLLHKQQISRDTSGLNITIDSDIPSRQGLGEEEAAIMAVAVALTRTGVDPIDIPARAKLVDVLHSSMAAFAPVCATRWRLACGLRGTTPCCLLDFVDGSIVPCDPPSGAVAYLVPGIGRNTADRIPGFFARREVFIQRAAKAYGTPCLSQITDAETRIVDWLKAYHAVHGDPTLPTTQQATSWLGYLTDEIKRTRTIALYSRSRNRDEVFSLIHHSHTDACGRWLKHHTDTPSGVRGVGVRAIRFTSAGLSPALVAWVDPQAQDRFASRLASAGVMPLHYGRMAACTNDRI